jgi:hypothetical protein
MTSTRAATQAAFLAIVGCSASVVSCSSAEEKKVPWCHESESLGPGTIDLGAHFADCPEITDTKVVPVRLGPGEIAQLSGTAKDMDSPNLTFTWIAESGSLANPSSPSTTYTCGGSEGVVKLTFIVSDGTCQDKVETAINCVR